MIHIPKSRTNFTAACGHVVIAGTPFVLVYRMDAVCEVCGLLEAQKHHEQSMQFDKAMAEEAEIC